MSVVKAKLAKKKYSNQSQHTNNTVDQSEIEAISCHWRQARENTCEQVKTGFGFILVIGLRNGASYFNQSRSKRMQNQRKRKLLSAFLRKIALQPEILIG